MKTLYFTIGLPASGKTTWSKKMQESDPNIVRVNKDDLRQLLHAGKWSNHNEKQVLRIRDQVVHDSLSMGRHVIVDDTNFHEKHETTMRSIARGNGAKFEIVDFTDVPLQTCIERDSKRENPVGKKVIYDMYNKYLKKDNNKPLNPVVFDENLPYCVIFDLDGSLAHINGRSPYEGKSCSSDLVNESIKFLFNLQLDPFSQRKYNSVENIGDKRLGYGVTKIILSGRNGESELETRKWLQDNQIYFNELHMRKEGDTRKDSIVKKEMFDEFIKDKYNVVFVVDDRDQVVQLWRSMGITCLQCNYGDF